ncbi:uncharacterized protein [Prorops nasuta]|uniref:uncharacterized protein n=1 Tax=Prorops nasuta TaxID=863751 RepID=UPI0034CF3A2C
MCDAGHSTKNHDCRLNFVGSAKAMEPKAAILLTKDNPVLNACNLEVGVIIADNDSSAIAAVRSVTNHEVVKQADKNHTSKGIVNELYKIKKSHKELSVNAINYLQKNFNYCISQNKCDIEAMTKAIENIPYHCYNIHDNCGTWCNYHKNPETYKHKVIGDGFQDPILLEALKSIFNTLASKCSHFLAGASSNPNESLNSMIVSKAPKTRQYGTSSSGSIRVACTVSKKNEGEKYIADIRTKFSLSPNKHNIKYCEKVDLHTKKRYLKALLPESKLRRRELKRSKTDLRNKMECTEGKLYETDVGLLGPLNDQIRVPILNENKEPVFVIFDLETGDFTKKSDILQIAAKCNNLEFSVYIKPTQKISEQASAVHGLRFTDGVLKLHENLIITVTLFEAIVGFFEFLCLFERKCILTAHNCAFDYPRIMQAIEQVFMKEHFKAIIEGFCDTLPIIRKTTGNKGKGSNKLQNLAINMQIDNANAHDAIADVTMLEQVLIKLNISNDKLKENYLSWSAAENKITFAKNLPTALKDLSALKDCTSASIRKKMVSANITYQMIVDAYNKNNYEGLSELLGKDENNRVKVTKIPKMFIIDLTHILQNFIQSSTVSLLQLSIKAKWTDL